jgi:hypothetical protein
MHSLTNLELDETDVEILDEGAIKEELVDPVVVLVTGAVMEVVVEDNDEVVDTELTVLLIGVPLGVVLDATKEDVVDPRLVVVLLEGSLVAVVLENTGAEAELEPSEPVMSLAAKLLEIALLDADEDDIVEEVDNVNEVNSVDEIDSVDEVNAMDEVDTTADVDEDCGTGFAHC